MTFPKIFPVVISLAFLSSSVTFAASAPEGAMSQGATPAETSKQMSQDGQIIAFIEAIDEHEIAAAKLALDKNVDSNVKDYANLMITDHQANLDSTKSLSDSDHIPANDSKSVEKFKEEGEKHLTSLKSLDDGKFSKDYVKAMVKGHTSALKMIDNFLKEVKNPALKDHLERTKAVVETHLEKAKALEASMKK